MDKISKKEYQHQYYLDNKERLNKYGQQYHFAHKEEMKVKQKQYRQDHKEEILPRQHQNHSKLATRRKCEVLTHYGNGELKCLHCGIADIDVLCIDHINGDGKEHRRTVPGGFYLYRWLKKNGFPKGYQTLCMNCNLKKAIQRRESGQNIKAS